MKVFIGATGTLLDYDMFVDAEPKMNDIGSAQIVLADNEFSAYNTYKDSHFAIVTIVDDDVDPEYVYNYDNTSGFTDQTTEATNNTVNNVNLTGKTGVPEVGDIIYIGRDEPFHMIRVDVYTANTDNVYTWEYWDGEQWSDVEAQDDTKTTYSLEADGIITWERKSDWAATTINSQSAYWIRGRVSTAGDSKPTATRIYAGFVYFEGRVDDVKLGRNETTLICSQLSKELDDITLNDTSGKTSNFCYDRGTVTSATSTVIRDDDKSWDDDELIGYAALITPSSLTLETTGVYPSAPLDPADTTSKLSGSWLLMASDSPSYKDRHYKVTSNSTNQIVSSFKFEGDEGDLNKLTVHAKFKVDKGTSVSGLLQIWDDDESEWDAVSDGAIDADNWVTVSADLASPGKYIDSDGIILTRLNISACVGYWTLRWMYHYIELDFTNDYGAADATFFVITDNDDHDMTVSGDPSTNNVQKGDQYEIGWRTDNILARIFTDYSFNMEEDGETSSNYSSRDFTDMKGLRAVRNLAELDAAHWWVARGRRFKYRTTFASSGLTIDETMFTPNSIEILRPACNYLKGVRVVGAPEASGTGVKSLVAEAESESSVSTIWLTVKKYVVTAFTELQKIADNIKDFLETMKTNVAFDMIGGSATQRALEIGKTVDFTFDVDGDTVDEITETTIVVRSLRYTQSVGEQLVTHVQLGFYPVDSRDRFLGNLNMNDVLTNIHSAGRDDQYTDRYLNKGGGEPPIASIDDLKMNPKTQEWKQVHKWSCYPNADDYGITINDQSNQTTINAVGGKDLILARLAEKKVIAGVSEIELGTGTNDESVVIYEDLDMGGGTGDIEMNVLSFDDGDVFTVDNNDISFRPDGTGDVQAGVGAEEVDFGATVDVTAGDDLDADDDLYLGASSFTIYEDGSNRLVLDVDEHVVINSAGVGCTLQFEEDATHYGYITYHHDHDQMEYVSMDGGNNSIHFFYQDIVLDAGRDVNPEYGNNGSVGTPTQYWEEMYCNHLHYMDYDVHPWDHLDDVGIIRSMVGDDGREQLPDLIKDKTGKFVNAGKKDKLTFGAIRQQDRRINELSEIIQHLQERIEKLEREKKNG